jgi:hypothetical protein
MILTWEAATDTELRELWKELGEWVQWAARVYPRLRSALRPCWPHHPEVIRELNAYAVWWQEVYAAEQNGQGVSRGRGAVWWHEQLPALCQRLDSDFQPCKERADGYCHRRSEYGDFEASELPHDSSIEPVGYIRLWEAPPPEFAPLEVKPNP